MREVAVTGARPVSAARLVPARSQAAGGPRATLRGGLPDRYLTPDDIAEIFEVPKETVYAWRKKQIGPPGFRIGKHTLTC